MAKLDQFRYHKGSSPAPLIICELRFLRLASSNTIFYLTFGYVVYKNLFELIQVRNKPIEPPKKAEKAPFFLPSVPTLSGQIVFEPSDISSEKKIAEGDKLENRRSDLPHSQFLQLLQSSAEKKSCKFKCLFPPVCLNAVDMFPLVKHLN